MPSPLSLPGDSSTGPAETSNIVRAPVDALCECCGDAAYYVLGCQGDEWLNFCADCAVSLLTEGSRATWEALLLATVEYDDFEWPDGAGNDFTERGLIRTTSDPSGEYTSHTTKAGRDLIQQALTGDADA